MRTGEKFLTHLLSEAKKYSLCSHTPRSVNVSVGAMNYFGFVAFSALIISCARWIRAITDEDLFVQTYGRHNTSGVWPYVRERQNSSKDLKNICRQAHESAGFEGKVGEAKFDTRTLEFENSEKYNPIPLDVIIYALKGLVIPEGTPDYFYITKGRTSRCVHYLAPNNETEAMSLKLFEQVCGINATETDEVECNKLSA